MRILGVLVTGFTLLAFGANGQKVSQEYLYDLKAYLTSKCFPLNGAMYRFDFNKNGVIEYNDWVYLSLRSGATYRLLGTLPTTTNPFGFKSVKVDVSSLTPEGYFSFINFPKDEDKRFSWLYLFDNGDKVAKLMGTTEDHFFAYLLVGNRPYIPDLGYVIEEDTVSIIYKWQAFPDIIASYDTPGFSWNLKLLGDKVLIADSLEGVSVVAISEINTPELLAKIDTYNAIDVDGYERYGYVADESQGVTLIDLQSFSKVKSLQLDGDIATKVVVFPEKAVYVATYGKVYIIDISRGRFERGGVLEFSGEVKDLEIVGDKLYVADNLNGLSIYSLANPLSPTKVKEISVEGINSLEVRDGIFYISLEESKKVIVLDTNNNSRYEFENPEIVTKVVLSPKKLYLVNKVASICVYDLTIPSHPTFKKKIYIPYPALDMEISSDGKYGFIAEGGDGLKILELEK